MSNVKILSPPSERARVGGAEPGAGGQTAHGAAGDSHAPHAARQGPIKYLYLGHL